MTSAAALVAQSVDRRIVTPFSVQEAHHFFPRL
jgi:hypothetical protein